MKTLSLCIQKKTLYHCSFEFKNLLRYCSQNEILYCCAFEHENTLPLNNRKIPLPFCVPPFTVARSKTKNFNTLTTLHISLRIINFVKNSHFCKKINIRQDIFLAKINIRKKITQNFFSAYNKK